MIIDHTIESLQAFEADIAEEFNAGRIRAPVHFSGGNEQQLLEIFEDVRPGDWVLTTWRSHYHCLLKGVPPDRLKADIVAGRSITLCYPEHHVLSSAIVGGTCPIAVGLAWAIKRAGLDRLVWCFIGDMAARSGMFLECLAYGALHDLPIRFVVEDNGLSVCTDTAEACGDMFGVADFLEHEGWGSRELRMYDYKLPWPHAGAGKRVSF